MATSPWNGIVSALFLVSVGTAFLIGWLPGRTIQIGSRSVSLDRRHVGWLTAITIVLCSVTIAGGFIVQAWSGDWTRGDWRGSEWFVALNGAFIFVGAPLIIVAALIHGWRQHRRGE